MAMQLAERFNVARHYSDLDELLGKEYSGNVFVCEPVNLLVHRLRLEPRDSTFAGHRPRGEESSEFLTSTDSRFRPVALLNAPDGSIGTPLANAVGYGCWDVARLLDARGADIDQPWIFIGLARPGRAAPGRQPRLRAGLPSVLARLLRRATSRRRVPPGPWSRPQLGPRLCQRHTARRRHRSRNPAREPHRMASPASRAKHGA